MSTRIRFASVIPRADRVHYVSKEDVCVVLSRLPGELHRRLQSVHFNDRSRGARSLGYVSQGHREIALCALPPRISLTRFLIKGQTPEQFGAMRGHQWPTLAVRRFMLYDVFLHELGHLQLVDKNTRSSRLRFAREKLAEAFATEWRNRLWKEKFAHPDAVHNAPTSEELIASRLTE